MNLKSTFALLVLAGGVAALIWQGSALAPKVGLAPEPNPPAAGTSATTLAKLDRSAITGLTIRAPGAAPIEFKAAGPGQPLELPGNWPVRRNEVEELIAVVTGVRSRFESMPVPVSKDLSEGLARYGLAPNQDPVVVTVQMTGATRTLTFGEAPERPGENPFTRPAYVHVDQEFEVLRLGPDILPVLRRPAEFYRKRQLYPDAERLKVTDTARLPEPTSMFLIGDAVRSIRVEGPNGGYTLTRTREMPEPLPLGDKAGNEAAVVAPRLADAWQITAPLSDRADPVKLKNVLAAIPDLWVEQFLPYATVLQLIGGWLPPEFIEKELPKLLGLSDDSLRLTVTMTNGSTRRVVIGKATRTKSSMVPAPPPPFPGAPPQPPKTVVESYHVARLEGSPFLFELRGDKFKDLFFNGEPEEGPKAEPLGTAFQQLRDPNPARFESDQVVHVKVTRSGQTLELKKTKGDPKAESPAARSDRWDLVSPFTGLAEAKQVTDLIEPLERLSAKATEVIDRPMLHLVTGGLGTADLVATGLSPDRATTVVVESDPKTNTPPRTLRIGKRNPDRKKMLVLGPQESRINVVDDAAHAVVERQPRAYRALKLFDLGDNRVEAITVVREKETFRLQESIGTTDTTYVLAQPVTATADTEKAKNLLRDLGTLEATDYVYDPLSDAEKAAVQTVLGGFGADMLKAATASFGLENPTATVTLNFAGPKAMSPRTLIVGKAREGKPEHYARMDGSPSVFAIKKEVVDALTGGSLGLLPLQLWSGSADGVKSLEIQRSTDPAYLLKQAGTTWTLAAPFEAKVDNEAIIPLATAVAALKAERYEAHAAKAHADYGFDKPAARVKFTLTERKVIKPGDEPKEETKERTLLIGKETEGKPGRFARLEGDANPAVFVVNETAFRDLDKPALDLIDRKLLSIVPSTVTKFETSGPAGTLTLQKEGTEWKPVGATFPVDKPTVDNLLRVLSNLNALKYAAYGENIDWAKYGLDPASKPATTTVTAGAETHKLEIGKPAEGFPNDRYARVDGGKAVAILPVTSARELAKGKLDLVDRTIFKFDPIDLQTIRRTGGGPDLEIVLEGTNWNVAKPTKFAADQKGLEDLSEKLATLRAERVADVEGKDLAKYGLDKPVTVKLEVLGKGARPVEKALKIGGPVDTMKPDGERFAQAEGATTVVVLGGPIAKRLLAEPVKFRDRELANFVTADKLIVTRDGKDVTYVKEGGVWKMQAPIAADAEDEGLRELTDALARLRAEEIVAEKPADLKPYGLDKPDRWRVFNGDREVLTLLVGAREKVGEPGKQKDGFRAYAKLEKGDLVVLLDMAQTAKVSGEYRKRAIWEPLDVATANAIEVDTPEGPGSFKLIKGPVGWIDPTNPVERVNNEFVTEFLDAIAGLKAERFVEHAPTDSGKIYGLDPVRKTITVKTQNGQSRTLRLGRLDDSKRAYARADTMGKPPIVLLAEPDTARLNRDRSGFLVAPPKPPEVKKAEPKKELEKKPEMKKEPEKKPEPKKEHEKKPETKKEQDKSEPKKEPEKKPETKKEPGKKPEGKKDPEKKPDASKKDEPKKAPEVKKDEPKKVDEKKAGSATEKGPMPRTASDPPAAKKEPAKKP
jgi:hypothetical protein